MQTTIVAAIVALIVGIALGYAINRFLIKDRTARAAEEAERLVETRRSKPRRSRRKPCSRPRTRSSA